MPCSSGLRIHLLSLLGLSLVLGSCSGDKADTSDSSDEDDGPLPADETAPEVSLDGPVAGETVSGTVSWAATATDNRRVSSVSFYADDSLVETDTEEPWAGSWDSTLSPNGEIEVRVVAVDVSGNTDSDALIVTVANESGLDPDAILITSPSDGATVCQDLAIETSVSEVVAQVAFSLNGAELEIDTSSPFGLDFDTTLVPDGAYTLTATAADSEGREAADSVTFTILNDDESCDNTPSIVFTEPQEGDAVAGLAEVSVTASDDIGVTSVVFYLDSGLLATDTVVPFETALTTTDFEDGSHTLKAIATDTAGQTEEAEVTFNIDNESPVLFIDEPAEADILSGSISFSVSATDNLGLDTVALYLDDALLEAFTAEPYEVEIDTTLLSYGAHTLSAQAFDLAGNEATDLIRVNVDNPPEVVFTAPTDTTAYGTVSVTAEATDDDRVEGMTLYQDGELIASVTPGDSVSATIATCDLAYGATIALEAFATDFGGNEGSETLTLTVDQPLRVEIDSYTEALDYTATLGASVSDDQSISSVVFALDGTTVATVTRPGSSSSDCFDCGCVAYQTSWSTASASEGSHTLSVTVTNSAGETATDSTVVTIDYDHDDDGADAEFYGGDDCDDEDTSFGPSAPESCDGEDQDCDGSTDEDFDADGDGYLDQDACEGVAGASDCDDTDADISPDASETCNLVDDNCDGHTDNSTSPTSTTTTFSSSSDTHSYLGTSGNVYRATTNATITSFSAWLNPGATSRTVTWAIYVATSATDDYSLVESNTTSPSGSATWYSSGSFEVELVSGYYYLLAVSSASTLARYGDDTPSTSTFSSGGGLKATGYRYSSSVLPTTIDGDYSTSLVYYQRVYTQVPVTADADVDADGYTPYCDDCDDDDATLNPGAAELCDEIDNDCDGSTDEAPDDDLDGEDACSDCDDSDPDSYTGGTEVCDGADNDCDGAVDDDPTDGTTWYLDGDTDGYGLSSSTARFCEETDGYAPLPGDCDDADAMRSPGLDEVCDGVDNDCDGRSDEDFDSDGDGYGAGSSCGDTEDCDDTDPDINVDGTEVCNAKDDDCNGETDDDASDGTLYYVDTDLDGYGVSTGTAILCALTSGYSTVSTDCDDSLSTVYPSATESCDELDNDCDGSTDEGFDGDGDGYASCSDCDDADDSAHPGGTEVCENDVDEDCSGSDTWCHISGEYDLGSTGSKVRGEADYDYAGYSVDVDGDHDGDGDADIVFGARHNDDGGTYAGAAYIVNGTSSGLSGRIQLTGEDTSDMAGSSVTWIGDQDGDGYDDLLVSATGMDDGGTGAGGAHVVMGPIASAMDLGDDDARIVGDRSGDGLGDALANAGDVNGDSETDMLFGAASYSTYGTSAGAVYLLLGPVTADVDFGTSGSYDFRAYGSDDYDQLGTFVAGGGDFNGDGYDDMLFGATAYGTSGAGYLVLGPSSSSGSISSYGDNYFTGVGRGDAAGLGLAIGDVDGDGYGDLLISEPYATYSSYSSAGNVYVFLGPTASSGTLSSRCDLRLSGGLYESFGRSISTGDLDLDGVEDVLVGAFHSDDATGAAYVFYGPLSTSTTSASADASYLGEDDDDYLGVSVDIGGDINGDGAPDFIMGAYNEDTSSTVATGAVYAIFQ